MAAARKGKKRPEVRERKWTDIAPFCASGTKKRSNRQYKIETKLAKLNCFKYSFFVKIIKFWK